MLIYIIFNCFVRDHIYIPGVEIIPATAFRLEPFKSSHDKGGYLTVDGELVKTEILQVNKICKNHSASDISIDKLLRNLMNELNLDKQAKIFFECLLP